jgi:hypothetical protein
LREIKKLNTRNVLIYNIAVPSLFLAFFASSNLFILIPASNGTPTSDTPAAYFIHETTTSLLLFSLGFSVPEIMIKATMAGYFPIFIDYHTNDPIHQDIKALLHVYIVERTHLHNVLTKIILVPVFLLHGPTMIKYLPSKRIDT